MAEKSLSEVLGKAAAAHAAAPAPAAKTGDAVATVTEATPAADVSADDLDDDGIPIGLREESEQEPEKADAAKAPETQEPWTKQAYLSEKKKRQEAERQALESKAKLEAIQQLQQQGEPKAKPKSNDELDIEFWANPRKAIETARETAVRELLDRELRKSVRRAAKAHEDWAERAAEFDEVAKKDPALEQEMLDADDPAEFAYQHVGVLRERKGTANLVEYRAKLKEETRREVLAEIEAKTKAKAADASQIVTSNASARGSGAGTAPAWSGPTPLSELVGLKRR